MIVLSIPHKMPVSRKAANVKRIYYFYRTFQRSVAIKRSRGSSLGAEKQFLKVRSRNYLPFSINGGDTQTHRQTDTTTAITLRPRFAGEG